jgi:Cdc6-like AAA superfamily ATPase
VNAVVEKLKSPLSPAKIRKRSKRKADEGFEYVYINCHGLSKQADLCMEIINGLHSKVKLNARTALNDMEEVLMDTKT